MVAAMTSSCTRGRDLPRYDRSLFVSEALTALGPSAISTESLARLLDGAQRIDPADVPPAPHHGRRGAPALRLVVDNR
jgi:hypothetical protein